MQSNTSDLLPDIRHTFELDASILTVWQAVTTSEMLAQWLMPNDLQLTLGHTFNFRSQPMGDWDGVIQCKLTELEPPNRISFSWSAMNMNHHVSFVLNEKDGKTQFTLVHSGWSQPSAMFRGIMDEGWVKNVEQLKTLIKA